MTVRRNCILSATAPTVAIRRRGASRGEKAEKRGPISMSKLKLFVLFAIACGQVFAQGERATISGTVTDSTGAVVPQVRVTVRNERTNIVNKAESNSTGLFVVPALPPGSYELTAEKQGFRTVKISEIPLSVGLA